MTALMWAAQRGHSVAMSSFLDSVANPDLQEKVSS